MIEQGPRWRILLEFVFSDWRPYIRLWARHLWGRAHRRFWRILRRCPVCHRTLDDAWLWPVGQAGRACIAQHVFVAKHRQPPAGDFTVLKDVDEIAAEQAEARRRSFSDEHDDEGDDFLLF